MHPARGRGPRAVSKVSSDGRTAGSWAPGVPLHRRDDEAAVGAPLSQGGGPARSAGPGLWGRYTTFEAAAYGIHRATIKIGAATSAGLPPAPASVTTVAPFRAWRGLPPIVAGNRRRSPLRRRCTGRHRGRFQIASAPRLRPGRIRRAAGGERGIRTLGTDLCPYTHFPGVLLKPLGHLS